MEITHNNMIPGVMTKDVEFFGVEEKRVHTFHDRKLWTDFSKLPGFIHRIIKNLMDNENATNAEMEAFVFEKFGGLDNEPDIDISGNISGTEYMPTHQTLKLRNGKEVSVSELRVLKLAKLPNKLIADQLFISPETVESHWQNMRHKTGLYNKVELACMATRRGVIL